MAPQSVVFDGPTDPTLAGKPQGQVPVAPKPQTPKPVPPPQSGGPNARISGVPIQERVNDVMNGTTGINTPAGKFGLPDAALMAATGMESPVWRAVVSALGGAAKATGQGGNPVGGAVTGGTLGLLPEIGGAISKGANTLGLSLGGVKGATSDVVAAMKRLNQDLRGTGDPYARNAASAASPAAVQTVAPTQNILSGLRRVLGIPNNSPITLGKPAAARALGDAGGSTLNAVESSDPTKYNVGDLINSGQPKLQSVRANVSGGGNAATDQDMISKIVNGVRKNVAVGQPIVNPGGAVYPGMSDFKAKVAQIQEMYTQAGKTPPSEQEITEQIANNTNLNGRQVGELKRDEIARGNSILQSRLANERVQPGQNVPSQTHLGIGHTLKDAQEASNPAVKPVNAQLSDLFRLQDANNALRGGTGPLSDLSTLGRQGGLSSQVARNISPTMGRLGGLAGLVGLRPSVISGLGNAAESSGIAAPGLVRALQLMLRGKDSQNGSQ